jgi:hypothetical protein
VRKSSPRKSAAGFEWAYRDLLIALVVVFMAMAALALVAARKASEAGVRQGAIAIEMGWQRDRNADVDLWVEAPGDAPVGFSHPGDAHCNLLRDDLGRELDPESRNEEMVICRGVPAGSAEGEWVVDAMLYRSYDHALPVRVTATVLSLGAGNVRTLLNRTVELAREGEQRTIWRFRINAQGGVVPGSVNHLPMALERVQ